MSSKLKAFFIFFASIIIYLQVVTVYIAHSHNLPKLLPFWKSLIWLYKSNIYNKNTQYNEISSSFLLFIFIPIIGLILTAYYRWDARNQRHKSKNLHGSARWANLKDIKNAGLLSHTGVVVGAFLDKNKKYYLIHDGAEHIYTNAPTRSGKGVSLIVPTLCTWRHSVIATDVKGELWSMTAGYRKQYLKNKVMKFEPASVNSVKWNPFDEIRIGTENETADAQSLALLIIDPQGKGLEDHWVKSAYSLITGCVLYLLEKKVKGEGNASLKDLDLLLSDTSRPLNMLWEDMKKADNIIAQQVGQDMLDKPDNEGGSIISTAKTELSLYRDPIVAENTSFSNFKVKDLMNNDAPVSLYIVTQPKDIKRVTPIFRLLLNMIIRVNVSEFTFTQTEAKNFTIFQKITRLIQGKSTVSYGSIKGKGNYKHRLLMMLDEFPSLGKIDIIQEALAYMAGYGIKAYLISQDIAQLNEKYGKNESITSNCHIQNAFAPNKIETAKYLSEQTGEATVVEEKITVSDGGFLGKKSHSKNYEHVKRALLTPDECMRLKGAEKNEKQEITKAGEMLIFVAGFPAIKGVQPLYFQEDVWSARASLLPPEKSDLIYQDIEPIENKDEISEAEI